MDEKKGGRITDLDLSSRIIRNSDQPVYIQLADILHQQILSDNYSPGEKLPSEVKLVKIFEVSPMTVRRSINLLAARDVIVTTRGSGTFVKTVELHDAAFHLSGIKGFTEDDENTAIRVLEARFADADEQIAAKLGVRRGERVIYIRRLLYIRNKPAYYHRGYLINDPRRPVVEAELEVSDLKGIFRGSGSSLIKNGDLSLEAVLLNKEECGILELPCGSPGMHLEHIYYDFTDNRLSWGWFAGSAVYFRMVTTVGLETMKGKKDERTE